MFDLNYIYDEWCIKAMSGIKISTLQIGGGYREGRGYGIVAKPVHGKQKLMACFTGWSWYGTDATHIYMSLQINEAYPHKEWKETIIKWIDIIKSIDDRVEFVVQKSQWWLKFPTDVHLLRLNLMTHMLRSSYEYAFIAVNTVRLVDIGMNPAIAFAVANNQSHHNFAIGNGCLLLDGRYLSLKREWFSTLHAFWHLFRGDKFKYKNHNDAELKKSLPHSPYSNADLIMSHPDFIRDTTRVEIEHLMNKDVEKMIAAGDLEGYKKMVAK